MGKRSSSLGANAAVVLLDGCMSRLFCARVRKMMDIAFFKA